MMFMRLYCCCLLDLGCFLCMALVAACRMAAVAAPGIMPVLGWAQLAVTTACTRDDICACVFCATLRVFCCRAALLLQLLLLLLQQILCASPTTFSAAQTAWFMVGLRQSSPAVTRLLQHCMQPFVHGTLV
jgi:hypothetical protein